MFVSPMVDTLTRRAQGDATLPPEQAAHRVDVVLLLAALLAGEPLTAAERGAVVLEVLRGWGRRLPSLGRHARTPRPPQ